MLRRLEELQDSNLLQIMVLNSPASTESFPAVGDDATSEKLRWSKSEGKYRTHATQ